MRLGEFAAQHNIECQKAANGLVFVTDRSEEVHKGLECLEDYTLWSVHDTAIWLVANEDIPSLMCITLKQVNPGRSATYWTVVDNQEVRDIAMRKARTVFEFEPGYADLEVFDAHGASLDFEHVIL